MRAEQKQKGVDLVVVMHSVGSLLTTFLFSEIFQQNCGTHCGKGAYGGIRGFKSAFSIKAS